ncbi:hypothetical protein RB595_004220 [Gaeumannomyces hyphopodioides]
MAPGQKLYPRATVKRIIKAESDCNVSKDADVTVFVDYIRFLQTVVNEAAIESKRAGEKGITPRSVKKVTAVCLVAWSGVSFGGRFPLLTCPFPTYLAGLPRQVQAVKRFSGSSVNETNRRPPHDTSHMFHRSPLQPRGRNTARLETLAGPCRGGVK